MKLSKLYCNDPRFKNIEFRLNGLNVIYADVETNSLNKNNSHDLGKTKFAEIIDFLLLKEIDKNHFLKKVKNNDKSIFENHIFYLEIYLNNGTYLTIKRAVKNNTKISFSLNEKTINDFIPPPNWNRENLSIKEAKKELSQYLQMDFFISKNYNYRKAISYSLRKQDDFKDIYELNKFLKGNHKDWKPFIFDLLGFDGELLNLKYNNEKEIKLLTKNLIIDTDNRDEVVAEIEIKKNEVEEKTNQIDQFNFYKYDKELIKKGVEKIENKISLFNQNSYQLNYEIEKLSSSIKNNFSFDIEKVKKVFEETSIYFPENLSTDYKKLIEFNQKLTTERNKLLRQTLENKRKELRSLNIELEKSNKERENLLSGLIDKDTFKRFKYLQKELAKLEGELNKLKDKLNIIDSILEKKKHIKALKNEIDKIIEKTKEVLNTTDNNQKYKEIRKRFNYFYKQIMGEDAVLSMHLNDNDNVDFSLKIKSKQNESKTTAKEEGNTYMKLLCVTFDLAILSTYNNESYYRFIYHDDVLSQQDHGIKERLLEILNTITKENDIQYIFSVIKSDLPVNEKDEFKYFEEEVILNLDDKENGEGTLFGFEF